MFQFQLFGMDAVYNENDNTLSYGGETRKFSVHQNSVKLKTLYFKFNNSCDLSCTYCFQKNEACHCDKEVNLAEYKHIVKELFGSSREEGEKSFGFDRYILFGGEPFIPSNYKNISYIFENCGDKKICAFSNGTFQDEYKKLLIKYADKLEMITITLDGPPDVHDKRRVYADGKGTFGDVLDHLKLLRTEKIPFTVQVNLDKDNMNAVEALLEILKSDLKIGDNSIILNIVLHEKNGMEEMELLSVYLKLKEKYHDLNLIVNSICYKKMLSIITDNGYILERCGIADTMVLDFQNERIYACPQSEMMTCGSFSENEIHMDKNLLDGYQKYSEKRKFPCNECSYRAMCMYGCSLERDCGTMVCRQKNKETIQYIFDHFTQLFEIE